MSESSAIRRVVTGHDREGKAIVLSDGAAPNVARRPNGLLSTVLWTTAEAPAAFTGADRGDAQVGIAPPARGTILRVVTFPPHSDRNAAAPPGLDHAHDPVRRAPRHPAMHATDTLDYALVLDGEIDMLLDEDEVHLRAGDILVQQGTNHAWVNRGDRPCTVAFVLIDAAGSPLVPAVSGD